MNGEAAFAMARTTGMEAQEPSARAFAIHLNIKTEQDRRDPVSALDEAASLAATLPDLQVLGTEVVRLAPIHPRMLFGRGKIEELSRKVEAIDLSRF